MNLRLKNYCNNSSLDFLTWTMSLTLTEIHYLVREINEDHKFFIMKPSHYQLQGLGFRV